MIDAKEPWDMEKKDVADHMEFRLVYGTSWEGLSIRTIYYDRNHKIIDWDRQPISPLAGTRQELVKDIIEMFSGIEDMLEATKKPIIKEEDLEKAENL